MGTTGTHRAMAVAVAAVCRALGGLTGGCTTGDAELKTCSRRQQQQGQQQEVPRVERGLVPCLSWRSTRLTG